MNKVNDIRVIDKVIDVYLWISQELNTAEVKLLGQKLIDLADHRATDVEVVYQSNRYPEAQYPSLEDILL